jgi:hypothetical protein
VKSINSLAHIFLTEKAFLYLVLQLAANEERCCSTNFLQQGIHENLQKPKQEKS